MAVLAESLEEERNVEANHRVSRNIERFRQPEAPRIATELRRIRQQRGRLLPAGEFFSASQAMTATGRPVRSRSRSAIASSVAELAAQTPAFSGGSLPIVVT